MLQCLVSCIILHLVYIIKCINHKNVVCFPAMCIYMFHTIGAKRCKWYLPFTASFAIWIAMNLIFHLRIIWWCHQLKHEHIQFVLTVDRFVNVSYGLYFGCWCLCAFKYWLLLFFSLTRNQLISDHFDNVCTILLRRKVLMVTNSCCILKIDCSLNFLSSL